MIAEFNWMDVLSSSPIVMVLVGFSIITLGIAIERAHYYYKRKGNPDATMESVLQKLRRGQKQEAVRVCESCKHPMGPVALQILEAQSEEPEKMEERIHIAMSEQKLFLERNLGMLATMAAVAPLVGLLGTVWGIMRAFRDMSSTGSAAPSVVAAGVAEALVTTAIGLIIAVPALMLYNYFAQRMGVMLTVAENHVRNLRLATVRGAAPAMHGRRAETKVSRREEPDSESTDESLEVVEAVLGD
jgi:biopolymer transport protein ExbB